MSKVTEVKVGRKFRLADYESKEIVVTAIVEKGETAEDVITELSDLIEAQGPNGKKEEKPKSGSKTNSGKSRGSKKEEVSDEEETETEESQEEDDGEEKTEEDDSEENDGGEEDDGEEGEQETSGKSNTGSAAGRGLKKETKSDEAAPKKKGLRAKGSVYSRESDLHRKLLGQMLKDAGLYKTDDQKKKAKAVSAKMAGKEFLDGDGEIMDSFKTEFTKLMKASKK